MSKLTEDIGVYVGGGAGTSGIMVSGASEVAGNSVVMWSLDLGFGR